MEFSKDNFVVLQLEMNRTFAFDYSLKCAYKLVVLIMLLFSIVVLPEVIMFKGQGAENNITQLMDCDASDTTGSSGDCEKDSFEDISDFLLIHTAIAELNNRFMSTKLYSNSSVFISYDEMDVNSPPPENSLI